MLSRLRALLSPPRPFPDPRPDAVLSVVGDVHGCLRPLEALLPRLPGQIVMVGDLVDRGEQSADVLRLLQDRPDIICLMGNHEAMLLDFLNDPMPQGASWLRHGGLQTLASFGVSGGLGAAGLPALRDGLAQAMGDPLIHWLGTRPRVFASGNVAVTHAGADPKRPIAEQTDTLVWGHPACGTVPRRDGTWIVHGHVIVPAPDVRNGVIRVDTGAYSGGPLSAAILGDGPLRFETSD